MIRCIYLICRYSGARFSSNKSAFCATIFTRPFDKFYYNLLTHCLCFSKFFSWNNLNCSFFLSYFMPFF